MNNAPDTQLADKQAALATDTVQSETRIDTGAARHNANHPDQGERPQLAAATTSAGPGVFPCQIIEADFEANIVTLEMRGDFSVSAGLKYLCDARAAALVPRTRTMLVCGCGDQHPVDSRGGGFIAAAEHCEKCAKEKFAQGQQKTASPPYSLDLDPAGIRALVADAITGALALGAQGSEHPPEGHWLKPFYEMGQASQDTNEVNTLVAKEYERWIRAHASGKDFDNFLAEERAQREADK